MIIVKFGLLLIAVFLVVSCTNTKLSPEAKYFKTITYTYFKEYDPEEYISVNKQENKRTILSVRKSKLSLVDYIKVDQALKSDGWNIISSKDNFYEYCHGEKLYIGALYPEKEKHFNLAGNEIIPFNKNEWAIIINYNEGKVNYCRKDKLPIIELDDL